MSDDYTPFDPPEPSRWERILRAVLGDWPESYVRKVLAWERAHIEEIDRRYARGSA